MSPAEPDLLLPRCVGGERAGPPEDCGGIWGYQNLIEAISDPKHPEHKDMVEWAGPDYDPEGFNLAAVNEALAIWSKSAG